MVTYSSPASYFSIWYNHGILELEGILEVIQGNCLIFTDEPKALNGFSMPVVSSLVIVAGPELKPRAF